MSLGKKEDEPWQKGLSVFDNLFSWGPTISRAPVIKLINNKSSSRPMLLTREKTFAYKDGLMHYRQVRPRLLSYHYQLSQILMRGFACHHLRTIIPHHFYDHYQKKKYRTFTIITKKRNTAGNIGFILPRLQIIKIFYTGNLG